MSEAGITPTAISAHCPVLAGFRLTPNSGLRASFNGPGITAENKGLARVPRVSLHAARSTES